MKTNEEKLLLSMRETSRTMGVSERTVFSLIKDGKLPCVRIGRRVMVSTSALEQWIANQQSKGGADHV